jgi:hypothetical protein
MQQQQSGYGFVHYPLTIPGIRSALQTTKEVRQVLVDDVLYDCALTHNLRSIIEKHRDQFLPELASMTREFAYTPEHFMKNVSSRDSYMQQDVFRPNQAPPPFNSDSFRFQDMNNRNNSRQIPPSYNPRPMDMFPQQQQQFPRAAYPGPSGPAGFPGMTQSQMPFPAPPAPSFAQKQFGGNFPMNDFNAPAPRPPAHLLSNPLQSSQNPSFMDNLMQTYPGSFQQQQQQQQQSLKTEDPFFAPPPSSSSPSRLPPGISPGGSALSSQSNPPPGFFSDYIIEPPTGDIRGRSSSNNSQPSSSFPPADNSSSNLLGSSSFPSAFPQNSSEGEW